MGYCPCLPSELEIQRGQLICLRTHSRRLPGAGGEARAGWRTLLPHPWVLQAELLFTGPRVHRMWSSFNEWFWQEKLWLPPNSSWVALEDRDGLVYPHPRDVLAALPLALALVAMRFTFER